MSFFIYFFIFYFFIIIFIYESNLHHEQQLEAIGFALVKQISPSHLNRL